MTLPIESLAGVYHVSVVSGWYFCYLLCIRYLAYIQEPAWAKPHRQASQATSQHSNIQGSHPHIHQLSLEKTYTFNPSFRKMKTPQVYRITSQTKDKKPICFKTPSTSTNQDKPGQRQWLRFQATGTEAKAKAKPRRGVSKSPKGIHENGTNTWEGEGSYMIYTPHALLGGFPPNGTKPALTTRCHDHIPAHRLIYIYLHGFQTQMRSLLKLAWSKRNSEG